MLVALKDVSSVFGEVQLIDRASDGRRIYGVARSAGLRSASDVRDAPLPAGLTFVVHPALTQPEEHVLGSLSPAFPGGLRRLGRARGAINLRYVPPHKVHDIEIPPPRTWRWTPGRVRAGGGDRIRRAGANPGVGAGQYDHQRQREDAEVGLVVGTAGEPGAHAAREDRERARKLQAGEGARRSAGALPLGRGVNGPQARRRLARRTLRARGDRKSALPRPFAHATRYARSASSAWSVSALATATQWVIPRRSLSARRAANSAGATPVRRGRRAGRRNW